MGQQLTFLVFGATGQTGRHFHFGSYRGAQGESPSSESGKLLIQSQHLELHKGSITNVDRIDELTQGVDFVISMLGNATLQRQSEIILHL